MIRRTIATLLVTAPAPVVLLAGPATAADAPVAGATTPDEPTATAPAQAEPTETTAAPAVEPAAPAPAETAPPAEAPATTTAATPPTTTTTPAPALGDAPPESTRRPARQKTTGSDKDRDLDGRRPARKTVAKTPAAAGGAAAPAASARGAGAPPGSLSPLGPTAVGVPSFFIDSFRIPPFLLPIYQAAGVQYGIRWEVLAAINEIETDYGRNLSVSSAGALGWMQFMPATWRQYGVDANLDGERDPFNPVDAIFAAARYLRAAGAAKDLRRAIFAYNHADWYVSDVLRRARLVAALPDDLVSSLTGLTQGIFPVGQPGGPSRGAPTPRLLPGIDDDRRLRIRASSDHAATAVTDGTVVAMGTNDRLGRYVRLRDAYGNVYTYGGLRSFSTQVPVPKGEASTKDEISVELGLPDRDPSPRLAASTTDRAAELAPLASSTPARPADATSDGIGASTDVDTGAASTTVVVAPAPSMAVRPPLSAESGSSQAALEPAVASAPAASSEVALPGASPTSGGVAPEAQPAPAPDPQIDSPASLPSIPPATTSTPPAPASTTPAPEPAPQATSETTPAEPTETQPAPEQPTTTVPPATTTPAPSATAPAAPTDTPAPETTPAPPTTTAPETPEESPAPVPSSPQPPDVEAAKEKADPVLDPLLPDRAIDLPAEQQDPQASTDAPAPKTTEAPAPSADALDRAFTVDYDLRPKDVRYTPLRKGSRVVAGTVLGQLGTSAAGDEGDDRDLDFEIRPAGRDAPRIDPRPIVRGWRLLESTALYRARAADVGPETAATTGQILLMDKQTLQRRVLDDGRVEIYSCGRRDISAGTIDRRVLATLEFLAASGFKPTVTSLRCGHGVYTSSGNVSHHTTGTAVDIAAINGVPIYGHQGKGSITDRVVRRLLTLQGTMKPAQIITLMQYDGTDNTLALADHDDHIHIGWRPGYQPTGDRAAELDALLKPEQWTKLVRRLDTIKNPKLPSRPSKFALHAARRADRLRARGAGGGD